MITTTKNRDLKEFNSFGIQAKASEFIEFDSKEELSEVFDSIADRKWEIISGGNNILLRSDWDGVIIHPKMKNINIISQTEIDVIVKVEGAVEWDDFVNWSTDRELWGVENLTLIPGYVGAAPVQNIGAYGVEVKDIIESVEMFCIDSKKFLSLHNSHCQFGYRNSIFKDTLKHSVIITAVTFKLSKIANPNINYGDLNIKVKELGGPTIKNIQNAITQIRQAKLPDPKIIGNVGSFFKNPVVEHNIAESLKLRFQDMPIYITPEGSKIPAGWLIEKSGWKGSKDGNVGIDSKQALVMINLGGATGEQILEFAYKIQKDIKSKFEISIEMEVNIL